jgi:RhoGAP domain
MQDDDEQQFRLRISNRERICIWYRQQDDIAVWSELLKLLSALNVRNWAAADVTDDVEKQELLRSVLADGSESFPFVSVYGLVLGGVATLRRLCASQRLSENESESERESKSECDALVSLGCDGLNAQDEHAFNALHRTCSSQTRNFDDLRNDVADEAVAVAASSSASLDASDESKRSDLLNDRDWMLLSPSSPSARDYLAVEASQALQLNTMSRYVDSSVNLVASVLHSPYSIIFGSEAQLEKAIEQEHERQGDDDGETLAPTSGDDEQSMGEWLLIYTNWYGREQKRVFRLVRRWTQSQANGDDSANAAVHLLKYLPDGATLRKERRIEAVDHVTVQSAGSIIVHYGDETPPDWIRGPSESIYAFVVALFVASSKRIDLSRNEASAMSLLENRMRLETLQRYLSAEQRLDADGLFRVPGAHRDNHAILALGALAPPLDAAILDLFPVHSVCAAYSLALRELTSPPLVPEELCADLSIFDAASLDDAATRQALLNHHLTNDQLLTIEAVLEFLADVVRHERRNQMTADNVARVLAPSVFHVTTPITPSSIVASISLLASLINDKV